MNRAEVIETMAHAFEKLIHGGNTTTIITKEKIAETLLDTLIAALPPYSANTYDEVNKMRVYYRELLALGKNNDK